MKEHSVTLPRETRKKAQYPWLRSYHVDEAFRGELAFNLRTPTESAMKPWYDFAIGTSIIVQDHAPRAERAWRRWQWIPVPNWRLNLI